MASLPTTHFRSITPSVRGANFNAHVNGWRGVCVLMVFFYHVANAGLIAIDRDSTLVQGVMFMVGSLRYGVEMFFMISGFVIIASLRRHRSIGDFVRDRAVRIFSVWLPVVLCVFVVGIVLGWKYLRDQTALQNLTVLLANGLLLPPLMPLPVLHPASWSLSYEWLFYLLAAAAGAIALRPAGWLRRSAWMIWLGIVSVLLCLLPRGLFFIPGVVLALGWIPLEKWRAVLRLPLLSLLIFLISWRWINIDRAEPGAYPISIIFLDNQGWLILLALLAATHLMACVCTASNGLSWLQSRVMQWLGNISYSFYLWHPIVMFAVKKPVVHWLQPVAGGWLGMVVFAVVSLPLAALVSWASYQLFERRLAGYWRQRHRDASSKQAMANEAAASTLPVDAGGVRLRAGL